MWSCCCRTASAARSGPTSLLPLAPGASQANPREMRPVLQPPSLAGALVVRGSTAVQLLTRPAPLSSASPLVAVELLFATADQAAEFATEVSEARNSHGLQQEGADRRSKRLLVSRFARRDAHSTMLDGR